MASGQLYFETALLPTGWASSVLVTVDAAGAIAAVVPDARPGRAKRFKGPAVPGLANVHSHAHQRAMAGLAERAGPGADSFWTWREVMYTFLDRMTPEDLEAIAAELYVEMLKAGYTAVGEFQYLHHQTDGSAYDEPAEMSLRCLAAAETAGIGITILPALYACGGFGGQAPAPGQRRFLNGADRFLEIVTTLADLCANRPHRNLGIAPHSLRAVTRELLGEALRGLDRLNPAAPVHIHLAEQDKEVEDCLAWSGGRRPVEWWLDSFEVSRRWCAIHATHMTPEETRRLAASGAVAGLCPTTESNLGDGIFNGSEFLAAGGAFAVGSDSHVTVSPADELRLFEYSQRLRHRSRNVLAGGPGRSTGRRLLDRALEGGATALARPIGAIAPGRRADVVVLDPNHPALIGRSGDEIIDSWIFAGGNGCVRDVIVGGSRMVSERRHHREDDVREDFARALQRLKN